MKLPITIEFNSGEVATFVAAPPEWVKWEKATGNTIGQAQSKIGISDLVFLAYHAMKREAAGKPVKSLDIWTETIANVEVASDDPKATQSEALAD
ncbi:MAG: hypothetical protein EBV86_01775 [Marivivens sp.]|nr:hypothetical protein [Marivivens sp.]